jgi:protein-tyrosine phosphatase
VAVPPSLRRVGRVLIRVVGGFACFLVFGNLTIFGASLVMQWRAEAATLDVPDVHGVPNLRAVDDHVWRGAHPTAEGYRELAANGVSVVVDLRGEEDAHKSDAEAEAAGLEVVHLPIRDGQVPKRADVERFIAIVDAATESGAHVFVHCGAGVGRTGAMSAAYLVASGEASPAEALRRNLAVGPPSLEQIAFVSSLADGSMDHPGPIVTAVSRVLDAPRRILANL